MESPPVTLELLRTVGRKLKSSLPSLKALTPGMPRQQSDIPQIPSDLPIDILNLLNPQEPPIEWKKNIAMLRQKAPCKPFIENKAATKSLENAIRKRKAPVTTNFTIEQSTPTASSLPVLKPSLLIRLKGSLTPNDYLTVEKKSLMDATAAINNSIDKEVKKTVEAFEDTSPNFQGEPRACKTSLSRLLTKLPGSTSAHNNTNAPTNIYFSGRMARGPTGDLFPRSGCIFNKSARPVMGSTKPIAAKDILFNGYQYNSIPSSNSYTATATPNDLTGLDLEEYPNNEYIYTGSSFVSKSVSGLANCEATINNTAVQKKNLYGTLPPIAGPADRVQTCDELTMGEVITKRDALLLEKKRGSQAQEEDTGLYSFVSWRRHNKEREGSTVVTEALKIDDTSIKFFPTMLSELTANYSKDLADNVNKNC